MVDPIRPKLQTHFSKTYSATHRTSQWSGPVWDSGVGAWMAGACCLLAAGTQAGIIRRLVGDPVPLFGNVVSPVAIGFERYGRRPSTIEGLPPHQPTRSHPPERPVQQGDLACYAA